MPLLGTPFAVRMSVLDERQAQANHGGQTLKRLAERGGLGMSEASAIAEKREWRKQETADAAKAIASAAQQSQRQPQWIPVGERLPPEGVRVLVYVPSCDLLPIQADEWNMQREAPVEWSSATIETGFMWDEHEFEEVTHWMPLPPPPGGIGEGEKP